MQFSTGITVGAVILFLVCTFLPTHDSHLHCLGIGICVSIARTGDQQLEWSLQLLLLLLPQLHVVSTTTTTTSSQKVDYPGDYPPAPYTATQPPPPTYHAAQPPVPYPT